MKNNPSDGNLLLFVPGNSGFQAVAAQGNRAYPGVVRDYSRLLVMIGVSEQNAYVVDVFRVEGGSQHDFVLVGDANNDGAIETDLERSAYGETPAAARCEGRAAQRGNRSRICRGTQLRLRVRARRQPRGNCRTVGGDLYQRGRTGGRGPHPRDLGVGRGTALREHAVRAARGRKRSQAR